MIKKFRTMMGLMTLAIMTVVMSCDNQNTDTVPTEVQANAASKSRLRFVDSKDYDTSGMDSWQEVTTIPDAITQYVTDNHAGLTIEEAWLTTTGEYIILLDDDTVLVFNASEQFIISFNLEAYAGSFEDDFEEVDSASLPQPILDYLIANHNGVGIDIAGLNAEDGEYVVVLESGIVLVFDTNGTLLDEFDEDDYEDDYEDDDYEDVEIDSLAQSIKDYIATNYAGAVIEFAVFDTEDEEYLIFLDSGIVVIFDKDGNFIEEDEDDGDYEDDCEEVDLADLPTAISDYVTANYAGEQIEEAWYDAEEMQYYIELSNDVVLIFAEDGSFVSEYTEDDDDGEDDDDDGE
ncbi:PepSY-like domain-containing protein [Fabibacter sp. E12]|nr:PepSY-like domain-containing protein [Roseivirga sp. E12]